MAKDIGDIISRISWPLFSCVLSSLIHITFYLLSSRLSRSVRLFVCLPVYMFVSLSLCWFVFLLQCYGQFVLVLCTIQRRNCLICLSINFCYLLSIEQYFNAIYKQKCHILKNLKWLKFLNYFICNFSYIWQYHKRPTIPCKFNLKRKKNRMIAKN